MSAGGVLRRTWLLPSRSLALALAACGDDDEGAARQAPPHRLRRRVAHRRLRAVRQAASTPRATRFSFAGSDELAAQIRQGVKPDVFAAANTKLPDALYDGGRGGEARSIFAGNRLVHRRAGRLRQGRLDRRPGRART